MTRTIGGALRRYVASGECGIPDAGASDDPAIEMLRRNARWAYRQELWLAVERRARKRTTVPPALVEGPDALMRRRATPMIQGLFPARERKVVLNFLGRSLLVLTEANIRGALTTTPCDHAAWMIANLYLESLGAPLLGPEAPKLLGLAEKARCYVTPNAATTRAFLVDVVVHEAAHVLQDSTREMAGLSGPHSQETLLSIDPRQTETFAYACEVYSTVLRDGLTPIEQRALPSILTVVTPLGGDRGVDGSELVDIVREACAARNGWKRILARCGPAGGAGRSDRGV